MVVLLYLLIAWGSSFGVNLTPKDGSIIVPYDSLRVVPNSSSHSVLSLPFSPQATAPTSLCKSFLVITRRAAALVLISSIGCSLNYFNMIRNNIPLFLLSKMGTKVKVSVVDNIYVAGGKIDELK